MTTIAIGQQPKNQPKQFILVTFSRARLREIQESLCIGESGLPYLDIGAVDKIVESDKEIVARVQERQRRRRGCLHLVLLFLILIGIGLSLKGCG